MNIERISLEDFAIDPALGNFPEASQAQRLVLRLLDGLPPANREQVEIFESIAARPWGEDLKTPRRIVALILGADAGKSLIASLFLLHRGLFADLSALRPGQRGVGLLVAPDVRTAAIPLSYIKGILNTSALIRAEVETETADSVKFLRGTEITVLPASIGGRAVRGRRFVAAVLEECAFFLDDSYRVNDQEIVRAVRPRLLPGAQLVGISTPWRKTGWLYGLHKAEFGRCERALVLQAATEVMRPDKNRKDLEEEFADDPTMAATEIGAQFAENVAGLFEAGDLEEAVDVGVRWREPMEGFQYQAACDPSGLKRDSWALTILGRARTGGVVQFSARAWRPGAAVERIVEETKAEMARYGLRSVVSDQYGSEVTKAHFSRAGIDFKEMPFTSGPSSPKTLGFRGLRELVLGRRIRLLDDGEQTRELQLLEVSRLAGGGERIAAPGRLHDDRACALALAVHALTSETGAVGWLRCLDREIERQQTRPPEPSSKVPLTDSGGAVLPQFLWR